MDIAPFTMHVQKQGRLKYLLLCLFPPMIIIYAYDLLLKSDLIPHSPVITWIMMISWSLSIILLGYFLIFKKNHSIHVEEHAITNKDWRGNTSTIYAQQIYGIRRNLLKEILLLDENSKILLCVEYNMMNRELFEKWLELHHIKCQNKEKVL